jgi:hypothetical protein
MASGHLRKAASGLLWQMQHPFARGMCSVTSTSSSETEALKAAARWIKTFGYIFLHNPPLSHPWQRYSNQETFLTNRKKKISQLNMVVSDMTPYRFVEFYRHFRVDDKGIAGSSETSLHLHQNRWHHVLEDSKLNNYCCGILNIHMSKFVFPA